MDDLISRQDVLNAVRKCSVKEVTPAYILIDKAEVMAELIMLPSVQQEQRWIPVTERLPKKKEKRYWICTDTGYQCQCRWTNDCYGFGPSESWKWKIIDVPQYTNVVAWMSLPEPYKEEKKK